MASFLQLSVHVGRLSRGHTGGRSAQESFFFAPVLHHPPALFDILFIDRRAQRSFVDRDIESCVPTTSSLFTIEDDVRENPDFVT